MPLQSRTSIFSQEIDVDVQRPKDSSIENNQYEFAEITGTPSADSGVETSFDVWNAAGEGRIVEMVSFSPGTLSVVWTFWVTSYDSDDNVIVRAYSRYPENPVLHFDPGMYVPGDGRIELTVLQTSGSNEGFSDSVQYRPV